MDGVQLGRRAREPILQSAPPIRRIQPAPSAGNGTTRSSCRAAGLSDSLGVSIGATCVTELVGQGDKSIVEKSVELLESSVKLLSIGLGLSSAFASNRRTGLEEPGST